MKFGIALPHIGSSASTNAIVEVAEMAESPGFDSVWALDRLLWPSRPSFKYLGNPRGEIPVAMKITYDPSIVLTFVAARTQKVQLGASVLVTPYRSPVIAAKMGATLDQLSRGRLVLGLGARRSGDEFDAAGETLSKRQEQTDEFLMALNEL
jgi:alkanesulfonate monooxygenase SsuD/methylene tetrahydromethanopterin reductase-like flavin-dependent oxidoreductase (luciferase family)